MKGGYIMIDCKGLDLTKGITEQTITGLYNQVKEAHKLNKPIYAWNCIWGTDGKVSPIEVFAIIFDGYIICTSSTLQVKVTNEDVVTVINLISE